MQIFNADIVVRNQLCLTGFNLGVRQTGCKVWDIILPPWSNNDPRLFVLIHRQVLESDYVTENLPKWIDLVFGCKQTGKAAIDAINVFHPAVSKNSTMPFLALSIIVYTTS